jgi:hypothetical protein
MEKTRPHIEDANRIASGRKGLITKIENTTITRCLHPDNSASAEMRNKAFLVWQRIGHLLMSEQDAPTIMPLPPLKKRAARGG